MCVVLLCLLQKACCEITVEAAAVSEEGICEGTMFGIGGEGVKVQKLAAGVFCGREHGRKKKGEKRSDSKTVLVFLPIITRR